MQVLPSHPGLTAVLTLHTRGRLRPGRHTTTGCLQHWMAAARPRAGIVGLVLGRCAEACSPCTLLVAWLR